MFDIVFPFGAILYFVKVTPGKSGQKNDIFGAQPNPPQKFKPTIFYS